MAAKPVCVYLYLGTIEYQTAWNLQKELAERRFLQEIPNLLLLMQHPHTITIGKTGNKEHLLVDPAFLAQKGITLLEVDRGGDITYHGPGQLIGYPILALPESQPDVIAYLRQLEETLICTLQQYHIPAGRKEEYTGVWVAEEKVAAIGVKVSHWITTHGFALNVATDLTHYDYIVPCGVRNKNVTSMVKLLDYPICIEDVIPKLVTQFGSTFDFQMIPFELAALPVLNEIISSLSGKEEA